MEHSSSFPVRTPARPRVICATLMLLAVSQAHAIFPPLQDVDMTTTNGVVTLRVFDPGDGAWHEKTFSPGDDMRNVSLDKGVAGFSGGRPVYSDVESVWGAVS